MGKIRVKTIGIEGDEKDEKKKAKERAEAKRIETAKKQGAREKQAKESEATIEKPSAVIASGAKQSIEKEIAASSSTPRNDETKTEEKSTKKAKKEKFQTKKSKKHSDSYLATAKLVDKTKTYQLSDALDILKKAKRTKLDETVELHINTQERGVSGNLTLPHGTGKKARIEIADYATDSKHVEELVQKILGGQVDFDILIATPETMSHLAKVARVLGPRGLMPNPKNGTISPKPVEASKKFEGGQINFKTEAKFPIIHLSVGKISFEEKQLAENVKAVLKAVQSKNIKNVTIKSTMSPGIKLNISA